MTDEIGGSADEAPARGFGGYERKESVMVRTWSYVMCMLAAMGLTAGVVCGVSDAAAEETNLILNRPYDYWPVPAYGGPNECTDAGDAVQLTDGVAGGADWGSKPTVGWCAGVNVPVVVRFDLGEAATLSELRFNTVGGGVAGVVDVGLRIYGSLDNQDYIPIGERKPPSVAEADKGTRRSIQMVVPLNGAKARYVAVAAMAPATWYFVFVDEIELMGVLPADPKTILPIQPGIPGGSARELQGVLSGGRRSFILAGNLVAPMERQVSSWPTSLASDARKDRDAFLAEAMKTPRPEDFEKLRLAFMQRQRIRAKSVYSNDTLVWEALPDEKFVMLSLPESVRPAQQASVHTVINALEATALGVANLTDKPQALSVSVSGGGKGSPQVTLRVARFFTTKGGQYVPDALLASDCPQVIPSGEARLVWAGVESTDANAGTYMYSISVRVGEQLRQIPLEVTVHNVTLSKKPQMDAFNWAYLNDGDSGDPAVYRPVFEKVREQMLKYRITDGACSSVGFPEKDSAENIIRPVEIDFTRLDKYLEFNKDFPWISFFYPLHQSYSNPSLDWFGTAEWMSDEYRAIVKEWVTKFVGRVKQSGRDYDGFYFQFFDETLDSKVAEFCRLVKEADPKVKIMATIPGADAASVREFVDAGIDIYVYHGTHLKYDQVATGHGWTDGFELLTSGGRKLWVYHAADSFFGNGRERDPLSVYRLMHWLAFRHGITGVGFWDMLHNNTRSGLNPWEDPLFFPMVDTISKKTPAPADVKTAEIVIPTRRWEHTRMGIEDYMLLKLVQDGIASTGPARRAAYQQQLDAILKTALSNLPDANPSIETRRTFRLKRLELIRLVETLNAKGEG
jgi:hypothetical protein